MECDALFLSAHLDDAVLSCSLRILEEAKSGRSVKVATLFSAAYPRLFGVDFYCGRRTEDVNALSLLGVADPIWLGFSDAVFRGPSYWSFSKIMTEEHLESRDFFDQVAVRACSLYGECNPKTVFLPLAVGRHIDHRCTFAIWEKLPPEAKIVFYEDRPYSFVPNSVFLRLQEIDAITEGAHDSIIGDREPSLADLMNGLSTVTMYKNVLKNKQKKHEYALCLAQGAGTQNSNAVSGVLLSRQPLRTDKMPVQVKAEVLGTRSRDDLEQIVKANAAYISQMGMLYDNMKTFRYENDSYARILDPSALYAERYWQLIR